MLDGCARMSSFEIFTFPVVVANSRHRLTSKKVSSSDQYSQRGTPEPVRSQVDAKAPVTQTHHYFQASKIQDAQKRIGLIERENKSISARLAAIYRGGTMVDCWNEYNKKSSHREKQNIELVRITVENQGILKRLKDRKPTYDRKQCELDWLAKLSDDIIAKGAGWRQSRTATIGLHTLQEKLHSPQHFGLENTYTTQGFQRLKAMLLKQNSRKYIRKNSRFALSARD